MHCYVASGAQSDLVWVEPCPDSPGGVKTTTQVDFQAIYSEVAKPYFSSSEFSMLWERLLDSVEDANQPLAVLGAPYVAAR